MKIKIIKGCASNGTLIENESFEALTEVQPAYDNASFAYRVTVNAERMLNRKKLRVYFKKKSDFIIETNTKVAKIATAAPVVLKMSTNEPKLSTASVNTLNPMLSDDRAIEEKFAKKFNALTRLTKAVAEGSVRALATSGSPGTGKTFTVLKLLRDYEKNKKIKVTLLKGTISTICLYMSLWEAREKNSVVVLDDCDVLGDMDAANMLKAAMDTSKTRTISYAKLSSYLEDNEIPQSFEFNGGIIYLSNVDFSREVERGTKMSVHYEAFLSRAHFISTVMKDSRERLIWVKSIVNTEEFRDEHNLTLATSLQIRDWLSANVNRLREISVRTAVKVADLIRAMPTTWSETAEETLCHD